MMTTVELIGCTVEELPTPVLVVHLDAFEANITRIADYCRQYDTAWRPHSKAHKCPDIARLQRQSGACGVTCAKLSEAELMVAHGIDDVLLANQIVDPRKLLRLARLQRRAHVVAIVDCAEAAADLSAAATAEDVTVPLLIDIDIGMHRTGVPPGEPAMALAGAIAQAPGIELEGIMGYEGHILGLHPPDQKSTACEAALDMLIETADLLRRHGLECATISAGGTGSYAITAAYPGITELQAGGGIFMDLMYRDAFHVQELDLALTVIATVTSRRAGSVILDAGFKTLSAYHHPPHALHRDDLEFDYLSAEHGVFRVAPGREGPKLKERVELAVGYSDSTTFLHDRLVGVRNGCVERVWELLGRGLVT
jgi:D-serine deaminase-like pyridoxal phosphate-dependent protein